LGLEEDLKAYAKKTHNTAWSITEGRTVPDVDDLTLANTAKTFEGTVLYADLAESTGLVKGYKNWFAAEVYKNYLYCASRVIIARGGTVTAFDGDRVMAVFVGDSKNSEATKCALQLSQRFFSPQSRRRTRAPPSASSKRWA
jgi:class 3 adenylate cyclase